MATAIESSSSDVAVCFDTELAGGSGVSQQTSSTAFSVLGGVKYKLEWKGLHLVKFWSFKTGFLT